MAQIALTGSPMRKSPSFRNSLASTWSAGTEQLGQRGAEGKIRARMKSLIALVTCGMMAGKRALSVYSNTNQRRNKKQDLSIIRSKSAPQLPIW